MEKKLNDFEGILSEMKSSFDLSFVNLPSAVENSEKDDFIFIYIYGEQYALKVNELKALQVKKKIIPIPSENKNFLGLAGMQGRVVPIYSLSTLLNIQNSAAEISGKEDNYILYGDNSQIGLAFSKIGIYRKISKKDIVPQQSTQNKFISYLVQFTDSVSNDLCVIPALNLELIADIILGKI